MLRNIQTILMKKHIMLLAENKAQQRLLIIGFWRNRYSSIAAQELIQIKKLLSNEVDVTSMEGLRSIAQLYQKNQEDEESKLNIILETSISPPLAQELKEQLSLSGAKLQQYPAFFGATRFLFGFYLIFIKETTKIGMLLSRFFYQLKSIQMVSLFDVDSFTSNERKELTHEMRYKTIFSNVVTHLPCLYFSYAWDVTRSIQFQLKNMEKNRFIRQQRFILNSYQMRPLIDAGGADTVHWITPVCHGSLQQRAFFVANRPFTLLLIARRSRYQLGPRYFRRGVNKFGHVANEVETEQVLWELPSLHKENLSRVRGIGSCVIHRGSIPIHWGHPNTVTPVPRIQVNPEFDQDEKHTKTHFDNLIERYGSPIYILNLIRQTKANPEIYLGIHFEDTISRIQLKYANPGGDNKSLQTPSHNLPLTSTGTSLYTQEFNSNGCSSTDDIEESLPSNTNISSNTSIKLTTKQLIYHAYDILSVSSLIGFNLAFKRLLLKTAVALDTTGFSLQYIHKTHQSEDNNNTQQIQDENKPNLVAIANQNGTIRINCIDCLDRTNLAQLSIGIEVLRRMLIALDCSLIESNVHVPTFSTDVPNISTDVPNSTGGVLGVCNDLSERLYNLDSRVPPESTPHVVWGVSGAPAECGSGLLGDVCDELPFELIELLTEAWGDLGDEISYAYAGSAAMHRTEVVREGGGWKAVKRSGNTSIATKRYIQNATTDFDKQRCFDLLIGKYKPSKNSTPLWDIQMFPDEEQRKMWSTPSNETGGPYEDPGEDREGQWGRKKECCYCVQTLPMNIMEGCLWPVREGDEDEVELNIETEIPMKYPLDSLHEISGLNKRHGTWDGRLDIKPNEM